MSPEALPRRYGGQLADNSIAVPNVPLDILNWTACSTACVRAVNHVDNTGRLQSVSRDENELYYDLIEAFGNRTGIPVLLNTSFNENEPIVEPK